MRIWSKLVAANAYLSRWNGSNIWRAAVIGKKLKTLRSNCTGMAAMFCAVPMWPTIAKMLSWLTSLCAASAARRGS